MESVSYDGVGAIIPSFNAARHIGGVVDRLLQILARERVIVVDDGSTDDTASVVQSFEVRVVTHPQNRGKGAALRTGFEEAARLGIEWVVTLDADGQHDVDEIASFIRRQRETGADIVVGNRMANRADMPAIRVFANWATSAFVSLRSGQRIPDSQNGFRLHRTASVAGLNLETNRYDTESEILIKAARRGAKIASVPVRTIYGEETSSVHPFIDTLRFFRMVAKSLFW